MEDNDGITWFDISEYGNKNPLPVMPDTLKGLMVEAEKMIALDHIQRNDVYMDLWQDFLRLTEKQSDEKWAIMVLLHIAVSGLKGTKEPPVIFQE